MRWRKRRMRRLDWLSLPQLWQGMQCVREVAQWRPTRGLLLRTGRGRRDDRPPRASKQERGGTEEQHAHTVSFTANKTDDEYKLSFSHWDPSLIIPADAYSTICLNVKQSG
eukprot:923287-Rhodomonas_salina.1